MKLNNRGMTLTELLVSITMLSVALISMYGLMSNLQKKKNEVDVKADDLIKIADIEKAFQDIVMKPTGYGVGKIYHCGSGVQISKFDVNYKEINIKYNLNSESNSGCNLYTLSVNNKVIEIKDNNDSNKNRKWTLKKSCEFLSPSEDNEDNTNHIYYYVIKCTEGNIVDYLKFQMYFSNVQ